MAKRNEASNIAAAELDFPVSVDITHISWLRPLNSRTAGTSRTRVTDIITNFAG